MEINRYTKSKLTGPLDPMINIDYDLKFSEINHRFIKFLDYLEPFGPGNSKPIFSTKNISNIGDVQLLGQNQDTLKFIIKTDELNLSVIGFKMIENYEKLLSKKPIDIAYTIDKNYWNGKSSIQLVLKDVVYSNEQ
jgi:single-stranded-DNA-specific exonuclease